MELNVKKYPKELNQLNINHGLRNFLIFKESWKKK